MKRVIKSSKFENQVWLVNKYGDLVVKLERDGSFWRIPKSAISSLLLDIGDEYRVEEIESEID